MSSQNTIRVYDSTLSLLGEIDDYQNSFFKRDLFKAGNFTIKINTNRPNASLLAVGNFVMFGRKADSSGIITKVESIIDQSGKGGMITTASGFECSHIFSWRCMLPGAGNDYYTLTGVAETIMKDMVKDQAGTDADVDRRFSLLNIVADTAYGSSHTVNARYTSSLLEELNKIAVASGVGFSLRINESTKKLDFDVIKGLSRIATQSTNGRAIFSEKYDTLKEFSTTLTVDNYRNYAFVAGQGQGADRTVREVYSTTTEPTDLSRKEMFIDARDLSTTTELDDRASQKLSQYNTTTIIDGRPLAYSQLKYRTDYDLGDTVTVGYGALSYDAQITAVTENYAPNVYEIEVQFNKEKKGLNQQLTTALSSIQAQAVANEQPLVTSTDRFIEYNTISGNVSTNWVAPATVSKVKILATAAGGAGGAGSVGAGNTLRAGGGGGGGGHGAVLIREVTVVPGNTYPIVLSQTGNTTLFGYTLTPGIAGGAGTTSAGGGAGANGTGGNVTTGNSAAGGIGAVGAAGGGGGGGATGAGTNAVAGTAGGATNGGNGGNGGIAELKRDWSAILGVTLGVAGGSGAGTNGNPGDIANSGSGSGASGGGTGGGSPTIGGIGGSAANVPIFEIAGCGGGGGGGNNHRGITNPQAGGNGGPAFVRLDW